MDDVNVLRQACCAFRNFFFFKWSNWTPLNPFWQAIKISSFCSKVSRAMYLKPHTLSIIPKGGTVWEITSLLKLFNGWRTLVRHVTMILMPEIRGSFICLWYQTWKLTGSVLRRMRSLSTCGISGMGVVYPIDISPTEHWRNSAVLLWKGSSKVGENRRRWSWGCFDLGVRV